MKDQTKVVLGLLAGIAAGGISALLFAPEDGAETRKKIAKKAKKLERKVKEKAQQYKEKAEGVIGHTSTQADQAIRSAEDYI